MIGIDTCHRLIEDRTLQELFESYKQQIIGEQNNLGNYNQQIIENQYRKYCRHKLLNRHVQVFTKYVISLFCT